MFRSRFLWKLYAGYATLIVLSATTVAALIVRRVERGSLEELRSSLRVRATLLREVASRSLGEPPDPSLQRRVRALGAEIGTRLTVVGTDGRVVADSEENPSAMDNHANRPEILAARSHGYGEAKRFSDTLGMAMMYLALPVETRGQLRGYARVSLPLSAADAQVRHFRGIAAAGAAASALVGLFLGFFVARRVARPLTTMTAVAESMACGDYERRLPGARKDEIGKLAQALNRMAESCRDRMRTTEADRARLLAILAGMVEGVVAVDRDERVLHMNAAAGRILRASPADSLGKRLWEVTRLHEMCETLTDTLRRAGEVKGQLKLAARPRDQVIEMRAAPLAGGADEPAGAVIVLNDVSEMDRLETVRRDFVANVSHELKTPVAAIRGLVETIIDDRRMDPAHRERFLLKIRDQSVRLSSVVADLLTLSRLESQGGALERKPIDLRDPVRAAAAALLPTADERGVAVETHVPDGPVTVAGDKEALCQVTSNLLDNALKYTARGGRVWVRLRSEGHAALIEVQDTGIGIEPKDQERIFERFYRVDKGRSRELGGTGLGLSIVKHIARLHGGEVSVESVPGVGSTFRVVIPSVPSSA